MDTDRFDALARSLARPGSRRGVLRALGAGGVGAGLAAVGLREGALACKKNGAPCKRKQAAQCCSGTCEKENGKRQCVKAEGAFGCTNEQKTDTCAGNSKVCPHHPNGRCIVDEKKRPYCYGDAGCFPCDSDQDCQDEFVHPKARCIKQCDACAADTGGRACVVPAGL